MFHKIKSVLVNVTVFLALLMSVLTPVMVHAAPVDSACEGLTATGQKCSGGKAGFTKIVKAVINVLSIIVGAVSVIMIIIGGFRYVVSAGDSNAISSAKNTILYAIVGLVIVLFAQIIVAFVITNVA